MPVENRRAEENKKLLEGFVEALDRNEMGIINDYWTDEMVWRGPAGLGTQRGVEAFEKNVREPFIASFPDKVAVNEAQIVGEDFVAVAGYQDTTFAQDWLGIPATGEKVQVRYMDVWSIKEGKLDENWVLIDILGVLEQAGYDVKKVLEFVGSKDPSFFEGVSPE